MNEKTNKAGAPFGDFGTKCPKVPKMGPTKSNDFAGRGGATERADFDGSAAKEAKAKFATTKFQHKSQQEQTAASKLRMEKRGEKLEKAKEKLAKQKPPKPPGPVRRVAGTVGGGVHGYVHGKLFEVEQENVGTEGAHRSELVGESALRHGKRFVQKKIREHPAKAVRKAESRHIKATADYHYRMASQEHPEMQGNALSRLIQKQKIKRQYAKQAREAAKQGAKAAEKTAVTTEKLAARAVGFVKRHPVGALLFVAVFLLLVMMQSCMSSLATLGNRPDLFPDSDYVGKYTGDPVEHEVPEEYLADETFSALLTEAEKYIGYPYVWGGSSPSTSFDCSGYLSWVLNQCGWNVGRLGAQGLYNYCTPTSSPRPGDLVFFVGTYDTPGVSHCGLYVGDGWMLHCGDPIGYANLNSSYWQSHFYAYGRLP